MQFFFLCKFALQLSGRVFSQGTVVNRPLAGTRRRGKTLLEDQQLEQDLRGDQKEVAEHVMLVDLGRNDVGKVY
jgi:anthranilate synthase component I